MGPAVTRPADCRKSALFDDTGTELLPEPDGVGHPHRVNQLRHGLSAIYITRAEQTLISIGFLPDPARTTTRPDSTASTGGPAA
jgi:hypothetical protein